jgi:hypothetical protein
MKYVLQVLGLFVFTLVVASFALRASGDSGTGLLYVSSTSGGTIDGVTFTDEDILELDTASSRWKMHLDGSTIGIRGSQKIDGFHVRHDGSVLFSVSAPTTLGSLGVIDDSDVIEFIPAATSISGDSDTGSDGGSDEIAAGDVATSAAGSLSMFFDGSAHGLTGNGEDIDAVALDQGGNLLISTTGTASVGFGLAGDEDVMMFDGSSLSLHLDGSAVGLGTSAEDVVGISAVAGGGVRLTVLGNYSVDGATGDRADIFECDPGNTGPITSCSWTNFWDGSANGFANESLNGFTSGASVTPPPPTTTTTTPTTTTTTTPPTTIPGQPPAPPDQAIFVISSTGGNIDGVPFTDEDVLVRDKASEQWAMYMDGSDVGLGGRQKLDALDVLPDGSILFSLLLSGRVPGLGTVDDSDVVRFIPTTVGPDTAGQFELVFDGSDYGLTTSAEDVDAAALDGDGRLLLSVSGTAAGGFGAAADEDILVFDGSSLSLFLDGSAVGLGGSSEDVSAIEVSPDGVIHLSTVGNYDVPGASGNRSDALQCVPTLAPDGTVASCNWSNYWDGSSVGFGTENLNALSATDSVFYLSDFSSALGPEWVLYDSVGHAGWGLRRPSAIGLTPDPTALGGSLLTITAKMGTGSESGLMVSGGMKLLLPQTYGRYTVRMRGEPDPDQVTSMVALLWPQTNQWPRDGEIDIVETHNFSARATREPIESALHWLRPGAEEPYTILDDAKALFDHNGVSGVDWHTYQLEWRENLVSVSVDGGEPLVLSTNPAEIADWNMELALQLDGFDSENAPGAQPSVSAPVSMYVDYVLVQP